MYFRASIQPLVGHEDYIRMDTGSRNRRKRARKKLMIKVDWEKVGQKNYQTGVRDYLIKQQHRWPKYFKCLEFLNIKEKSRHTRLLSSGLSWFMNSYVNYDEIVFILTCTVPLEVCM